MPPLSVLEFLLQTERLSLQELSQLSGDEFTLLKKFFSEKRLNEAEIAPQWAQANGFDFRHSLDSAEPGALALLEKQQAHQLRAIPLNLTNGNLRVALPFPLDLKIIATLENQIGKNIVPVICTAQTMEQGLHRFYPLQQKSSTDIAALVESILREAYHLGASDVHFEPLSSALRIRYRLDGHLQHILELPQEMTSLVINRLKLMSHLNLAESRLPQDGRTRLSLSRNSHLDLRIATISGMHGENTVVRLMHAKLFDLPALGFSQEDESLFRSMLQTMGGLILVTGPTGSGKSTTLYAALQALNQIEKKIVSVEDPVELRLRGVSQTSVHPHIGMTFATALRAILRQSPDIIMIGEIRDRETAAIATHAALTGHLVLSSLHTNDCASTPARLIDMDIKPFLVASCLRGVVAQRLVRKICPACQASQNEVPCTFCQGTGYHGSTGLFEIMPISETLHDMIHADSTVQQVHKQALTEGMTPLRQSGLRKVEEGITTLAEILTNTPNV